MKRVLLIIFVIYIIALLSGCSFNENNSAGLIESHTFEEEEIGFEIEQILFSKSFQSIEPTVELISKNNKVKIMASLGLSEYSGINVNNITKKGNEINIHVSGVSDPSDTRLAIPQVIMELKKFKAQNIDELKFNIVYDDYTPLKIKLSINDLLNKVQSHFKVAFKGMPEFSLNKIDESLVWSIRYNSVFDRDNPDTPLVNLTAEIDANSGDILKSEKVFIGSLLDNGQVLSYIPSQYLLYKKSMTDDDSKMSQQLWIYDIVNEEKTRAYSTKFKITSAEFSPDLKYISLLETNEDNSELFIISLEDLKAFKVYFEDRFNPSIIRWGEDGKLYLIDSKDESIVYSYDVKSNHMEYIGSVKKEIENLTIQDEKFIVTEKDSKEANSRISMTTNWKTFKSIDEGFSPKFISEDLISYLVKNEKSDTNSLLIYYLKDNRIIGQIPENIVNYELLPDNNIVFLKKNIDNNNYTLSKYSLEDKSISEIVKLIGDKVYYNEEKNTAYLNITLPFEDEKTEVIYAVDLTKLN